MIRPPQPPIDVDVKRYIYAAGITSFDLKRSADYIVSGIKKDNLTWINIVAIYLMLGTVAKNFSFNLKNPRDLDAAFRLTFVASPTFSPRGVDWNGATQYADTHVVPSTSLSTSAGYFSYYSREDIAAAAVQEIGSLDGNNANNEQSLITKFTSALFYAIYGTSFPNVSNSSSLGFYIINRTATNVEGYKNSSRVINSAAAGGMSAFSIYIGARNATGTADRFSTKQCACSIIGSNSLTVAQALSMYNVIQQGQIINFQRQV